MGIKEYQTKRDFSKSPEPKGGKRKVQTKGKKRIFVVQEHFARSHHFDFRLELNGTLKSWAVPKGVSKELGEKRLAVHVEDHPLSYAGFEGQIPEGHYGAGKVKIWDRGNWETFNSESARKMYKEGHLKFYLHGKKLRGIWSLVRLKPRLNEKSKQESWLLIKGRE